ncbi:diguanylate cyclase [Candidatus Magnetominusculus dajiuhuensis]|uniref:diguanylate cyclase n=1 Tax=Candidatus Magnetominusculus dajiuhuensis TaxID=3137712 RepID=UPI003B4295B9
MKEMKEMKVLLIDDDEEDVLLVRDYLKEGFKNISLKIVDVRTFPDAIEQLLTGGFDVIIVDYMLGEADGLEVIERARVEGITTPIIFLTGHGDEEIVLSAMKKGAKDYLNKSRITTELLCHSIMSAVRLGEMQAMRLDAERALRESEMKYRTLVAFLPAIVCEMSNEGIISFLNDSAAKILGVASKELIGKAWRDCFLTPSEENAVDEDFSRNLAKFYNILSLCNINNLELKTNMGGSEDKYINWNSTCLYRDDGSPNSIICVGTDVTEVAVLRERLHKLSIVDELTGLYNRRGFYALAEQQFKIAGRYNKQMMIVFLDLDGLKLINDTRGHKDGDVIIKAAADVLKDTFREADIIGRMGGDEFIVLVSRMGDEVEDTIRARLAANVRNYNRSHIEDNMTLSLSTGITIYNPEKPATLDELIAEADALMYKDKEIKKAGRANIA